ncbi:hypothetical protein BDW59DRAFT_168914 [Aspergillus cavernicola]|uniref:Uncharacterized protein n=1 Tax=Aspergillus cavernicola TaxID=176166 RepID=A0ABR4J1G9_9EURO
MTPTGGTRPSGSRARRLNRSSSDDYGVRAPDVFQEEDLRAGGPHLCEAPCYSVEMPLNHHLHHVLCVECRYDADIQKLGEQRGIRISDISFVGRKSRYTPDDKPILTALLTLHHQNLVQQGWAKLAKDVWRYLSDRNVRPISVEIVDQRFTMGPYIFPCQQADAIYPIWETVCMRILANTNLQGIISIGCHRVGNASEPESCIPTILVTVSRECGRKWKPVREDIVAILAHFHLHMVAVIIRKDMGVLSSGSPQTRVLTVDECTSVAKVGGSLGTNGSSMDRGTLGATLELYLANKGKWVEVGLTCSHCVLPWDEEDLRTMSVDDQTAWTRDGVRADDPNARRLLRIDSPCYRDVQEGMANLDETMTELRQDPEYEMVERADAEGESVIGPNRSRWRATNRQIELLGGWKAKMKRYLENGEHELGYVLAASGLREGSSTTAMPNPIKLPSIKDWALIEPIERRSLGSNDFCSDLKWVEKLEFLMRGPTATIRKDTKLHKLGRKTGATWGRYNGLKTATVAEHVVNGHVVHKPTFEHTIVSQGRGVEAFELPGDSGALVYSVSGEVVGMCFGGFNHGDVGYFTHIHDLLDDITAVTGATEIRLKE